LVPRDFLERFPLSRSQTNPRPHLHLLLVLRNRSQGLFQNFRGAALVAASLVMPGPSDCDSLQSRGDRPGPAPNSNFCKVFSASECYL